MFRSALPVALAASLSLPPAASAQTDAPDPADWQAVLEAADGQTVYWHAWGGATATNDFIAWVGERVAEQGVTLEHVKLSDTADAVTRVLSEKQAGEDADGAVDLIWINGPNFASMKAQDLLFGPFAEALPNWQYVDVEGKTVQTDFTVPTDGLESPWAMAQVVFMHDTADLPEPLPSAEAILGWAEANPGRFTFPQPPDFLGSTFLKQMLIELVDDSAVLQSPADEADFDAVTAPLWSFLDRLTPVLWRQGQAYPATGPAQVQLIADNEIDLAVSFSPNEASLFIAQNQLPPTVRTFVLEDGTLGNASFVAIPYNSGSKAGAMVVANALLAPEVQARAQDPAVLGYNTVLAMDKLSEEQRAMFDAIELGVATLSPDELGTVQPEPHPSWMTRVTEIWTERYGSGQ